ncbi:MAG: twin-arginine translocase subunit TatB [Dehalococcoidaceae bacterium]|nr:twin-arginine translocase subunit TatB [Dehalococcoidaceae bacterium]
MGIMEILLVLVVALIVLGPDKLPEYARKAGRYYREFRKMASGLTGEMTKALGIDDEDGEGGIADDFRSVRDDISQLRKSLNEDADELKGAVDSEARQMTESLSKDADEIVSGIQSDSREMSQELSESIEEISTDLEQEAAELKESIAEDSRKLTEAVEKGGEQLQQTLEEEAQDLKEVVESRVQEATTDTDKPGSGSEAANG